MFELGEKYLTAKRHSQDIEIGDLIICYEYNKPYLAKFYSIKNNVKFDVTRNDFSNIHAIVENKQFKDMLFVFELSSCNFKYPFYEKVVECASGTTSRHITTETSFLVSDSKNGSPLRAAARKKGIKVIKESKFWELYYT